MIEDQLANGSDGSKLVRCVQVPTPLARPTTLDMLMFPGPPATKIWECLAESEEDMGNSRTSRGSMRRTCRALRECVDRGLVRSLIWVHQAFMAKYRTPRLWRRGAGALLPLSAAAARFTCLRRFILRLGYGDLDQTPLAEALSVHHNVTGLRMFTELEEVVVCGTVSSFCVSKALMEAFATLPALSRIIFSNCQVALAGAPLLQHCPRLTSLTTQSVVIRPNGNVRIKIEELIKVRSMNAFTSLIVYTPRLHMWPYLFYVSHSPPPPHYTHSSQNPWRPWWCGDAHCVSLCLCFFSFPHAGDALP